MRSADFVWDKTKMESFIADPEAVVADSKMKPYGGLASAAARKEVIAFLDSLTTGH
jgi:cytochrome c2